MCILNECGLWSWDILSSFPNAGVGMNTHDGYLYLSLSLYIYKVNLRYQIQNPFNHLLQIILCSHINRVNSYCKISSSYIQVVYNLVL